MAYSKKQIDKLFEEICLQIEDAIPLRHILKDKGMPDTHTFYKWLREDDDKFQRYARAKEIMADAMFEDILLISDGTDNDILFDEEGNENVNHHIIQRDKLRADNRKWILSKLNPKKYGDRKAIDHTTNGKEIKAPILQNDPLANVQDDNGTTED